MTDGNTHAIAQHLDEREDWDALQEVTAELEQAEARIEELELAVKYEADLAQMALDSRKELEAQLAKAVEAFRVIEDASGLYASDRESDIENVRYAHGCTRRLCVATLAALKGPYDE